MEENVYRALLFGAGMLLGAVMLMDVITTQFLLGLGYSELNPAMGFFVSSPYLHFGLKVLVATVFVVISAFCDARYVDKSGVAVLFIGGVAFFPAVIHNMSVLGAAL